ncbi:hypothetical protein STEG23_018841, partial [Scotinomys teguina]
MLHSSGTIFEINSTGKETEAKTANGIRLHPRVSSSHQGHHSLYAAKKKSILYAVGWILDSSHSKLKRKTQGYYPVGDPLTDFSERAPVTTNNSGSLEEDTELTGKVMKQT